MLQPVKRFRMFAVWCLVLVFDIGVYNIVFASQTSLQFLLACRRTRDPRFGGICLTTKAFRPIIFFAVHSF